MRGLACVKCKVFMICKKTGVWVEEGMPKSGDVWGPYKLWQADLAECPNCGFELITGFGANPVREHFMPDYAEVAERVKPMVRIDACAGYKP